MKKQDIVVFWLDGTKTVFPAVKMDTVSTEDEKGKMAKMGFQFGRNKHVACINLDNIRFFEITKTCTEE